MNISKEELAEIIREELLAVLKEKTDGKGAKDYSKDSGLKLKQWFDDGGWVQVGGKYDGKPCAKQKGPGRDKALGRAKNPLNFFLLIGRPLNFGGQFTLRLTYCQVLWHAGLLD